MKANLQWLDDPKVFRVNCLDAHSDHKIFADEKDFRANEQNCTRVWMDTGIFGGQKMQKNGRKIFLKLRLTIRDFLKFQCLLI